MYQPWYAILIQKLFVSIKKKINKKKHCKKHLLTTLVCMAQFDSLHWLFSWYLFIFILLKNNFYNYLGNMIPKKE